MAAKKVKKTTVKKPAKKSVKTPMKMKCCPGKTLVLIGAVVAILGSFLWGRYLPLIGGILVLLGEFSKK